MAPKNQYGKKAAMIITVTKLEKDRDSKIKSIQIVSKGCLVLKGLKLELNAVNVAFGLNLAYICAKYCKPLIESN